MTDEPRESFTIGNEQWLTFWLARDRVITRFDVSIGKAQVMLTDLRTSKEVRVLPINPPGTSVPPKPETDGSEQFLFSEADLLHSTNQQAPQAQQTKPAAPNKQYKRSRAKAAIAALWPNKLPDPLDLPNKVLCARVNNWLTADCKKRNSTPVAMDNDTILRAAGRKK